MFIQQPVAAAESFVLGQIEMQGLQRISEGTVLNYLPLRVGDTIDDDDIKLAIRSLFRAGFFRDIAARRDGNTLILEFLERPSIAAFEVTGNKDIDSETLNGILRAEGLAEGRVFDKSILDGMTQELYNVYHSRGKYSVHINTDVRELPGNLVEISIVINEGAVASIRKINFIGNEIFGDEKLQKQMELQESGFWSWIDDEDKYSREKLVGDLEKLKTYYYNRGYADFSVDSVQVSLSDSREDVYITLSLHEGEIYTVSGSSFAGQLILPEFMYRRYIALQEGEQFNMVLAMGASIMMQQLLESEGYAFAKIEPIPKVDRETRTVEIVYQVEPGERSFVRSIEFKGAPKTNDEVYRREMRQFESAWMSNALIERGKSRLERLPYVERVETSTTPVPGSPDLVDVTYDIKERNSGSFLFGVGFGGSATGVLLNASVTNTNFLGTGERVDVSALSSSFSKQISFSHSDPYATIDEVSRSWTAYYTKSDAFGRGLESFNTDVYGARLTYSYPLSEYEYLSGGVGLAHNEISTAADRSSLVISEFISNDAHGDSYSVDLGTTELIGINYNEISLQAGYIYDTRNRYLFATRGRRVDANMSVSPPLGDISYYKFNFSLREFFPLGSGYTLTSRLNLGYVDIFGDTTQLPPGSRFFGGGFESLRAFRESNIGPRDTNTFDVDGNLTHAATNYPIGGKLSAFIQTELLLPNFAADDPTLPPENTQFSLFVDTGYIYEEPGDFDIEEFRVSAGVAATFLTPIGALRFSFGVPIRYRPTDRTERIQFSVGSVF